MDDMEHLTKRARHGAEFGRSGVFRRRGGDGGRPPPGPEPMATAANARQAPILHPKPAPPEPAPPEPAPESAPPGPAAPEPAPESAPPGPALAPEFRLPDGFVDAFRGLPSPFGFDGLGEVVYRRTYSRIIPDGPRAGQNETWTDTVRRVVEGTYELQRRHIDRYHLGWKEDMGQRSAREMFTRMWHMKFLPPGRGLWTMGTDIVNKRGLAAALNNCGFVSTADLAKNPVRPFTFLMEASMLGVGIGFDTRGAGTITVDAPADGEPVVFAVPDSREGWVESLDVLLRGYLLLGRPILGKPRPTVFDYSLLRPRGTPLKTFGGVSSGPGPLRGLHEALRARLDEESGKPISSTLIVDIMNLIGKCVVSGNVRRSAELALGSHADDDFLSLKDYEKNPRRADYGWASNNSVIAEIGMDYSSIAARISDNGEPGLAWLETMRNCGRLCDPPDGKDKRACGANPCITGDTMILTDDGLVPVSDLVGVRFTAIVHGVAYPSTRSGFWLTGEKPVYTVTIDNGQTIRATADHRFMTVEGWKETSALIGSELTLSVNDHYVWGGGNGTMEEGYFIGQLITFHTDPRTYAPAVSPEDRAQGLNHRGDSEESMVARGGEKIEPVAGIAAISSAEVVSFLHLARRMEEKVPENGSYPFTVGLLRGLFNSDGTVIDPQAKRISIRIFPTCSTESDVGGGAPYIARSRIVRLQAIQRLLLAMGVESKICRAPSCRSRNGQRASILIPDGKGGMAMYDQSPTHELSISGASLVLFYELVRFGDDRKAAKLGELVGPAMRRPDRDKFTSKVLSVVPSGTSPVYDCSIPEVHSFSANGTIAHNCMEQTLESFELCTLVENFPAHHESMEDFLRTLKFSYLYAKTVTLALTQWVETNRVMMRNRRIGCSVSGIAQFLADHSTEEMRVWLTEGYKVVEGWDRVYSEFFAVPRSIKMTTVKPSGTVSKLAGATPGIHPPESRYVLRRVRFPKDSPQLPPLAEAGYHIEPEIGKEDTSVVVSFPIDYGPGVRTLDEVGMFEQALRAAFFQKWWADNQVSFTASFDPETEGPQIPALLDHMQYMLKGISLIRRERSGGAPPYPQMPNTAITEGEYEAIRAGVRPFNYVEANGRGIGAPQEAEVEVYCDEDICMRLPPRGPAPPSPLSPILPKTAPYRHERA